MLHLRTRKQRITALAFSPDGRHLAVGGTAKRVDVWNLTTTRSKPQLLPEMTRGPAWLGFTPAGLLVVVTDRGQFQLYDPATTALHAPVTPGLAYLNSGALSADGAALFTCGWMTRRIDVSPEFPVRWSVANNEPREPRLYAMSGCFLDSEGRFVVPFVDDDRRAFLRAHDPETGAAVGERPLADVWPDPFRVSPDLTTAAFIDDLRLCAGPLAGTNFPVVREVPDRPAVYRGLAFHPSGKWLMCGTAAGVRIYETATWREAKVLEWDVGPLDVLAFDADGTRAAGGGERGTVVVWDWDL